MLKKLAARLAIALLLPLGLLPTLAWSTEAARQVPTLDQLLNLKTVSGAQISPDGKYVAYTVSQADFKQDAFITQIWLVEVATQRRTQLTRSEKAIDIAINVAKRPRAQQQPRQ